MLLRLEIEVHLIHPKLEFREVDTIMQSLKAENEKLSISLIEWPRMGSIPGGYLLENWQYSGECRKIIDSSSKFANAPIIAKGFTGLKLVRGYRVWINLHGYEMYQRQFSLKGRLASLWLRFPVRFLHAHCSGYFSYGPGITAICKSAGIDRNNHVEIAGGVDESWLRRSISMKSRVDGPIKYIFLGRNERRKALPELMAAWSELPDGNRTLQFIGPHDPAEWSESKNVEFLGEIRDENRLKSMLDQGDVLLCPSYSEGMPNVIMEGMARGLAIMATDVGAVSVLVGSDNGVLLEEVAVEGIVDAFRVFEATSSEDLHKMKQKSLEKIRDFTWTSLESHYLEFLERICE